MPKIVLTQEMAEQFAGALLAIVRTDNEIQPHEGRAVQEVMAEIVEGASVDFADVMLLRVTPQTFAESVRKAGGSAYRGPSVSAPEEIARAYSEAARRVAGSDDDLTSHEMAVVNRYLEALRG